MEKQKKEFLISSFVNLNFATSNQYVEHAHV